MPGNVLPMKMNEGSCELLIAGTCCLTESEGEKEGGRERGREREMERDREWLSCQA